MVVKPETYDIPKLQEELIGKYEAATQGAQDNAGYFEGTRRPTSIGIAAPPELQKLSPSIGYPRLYILSLAERITPEGFQLPGQSDTDTELWNWWTANRLDTEFTLGCVEALIHGCAYATISAPPAEMAPGVVPDVPIIQMESPTTVYADVDPWTRTVKSGIRVFKNEDEKINRVTIYTPVSTHYREEGENGWVDYQPPVVHNLGVVPIVPLMNRRKLSDSLGTSEITPELKTFTDAAGRLMTNMQAAAELMAIPQRVLFGVARGDLVDANGKPSSTFDTYMSSILTVANPDGKVDQFQAAQLQNFADGMREIRNEVAAYTGLPPQYLSNASDNPASADAIRSAERRLVTNAERKCSVFGGDLEQVMRVAWMVMNPGSELPPDMYRLQAIFRNPSTPTYEAKADAASKLYQNGQGIIPKEQARIDIGYSPEARAAMREMDEDEKDDLVALYGRAMNGTQQSEPNGVPGSPSGDSPGDAESDD